MITYHARLIEARLQRLEGVFPIVAVVGGRQVGKTTLLRHFLGGSAKCITFDPLDDLYGARTDPDLFLDQQATPLPTIGAPTREPKSTWSWNWTAGSGPSRARRAPA